MKTIKTSYFLILMLVGIKCLAQSVPVLGLDLKKHADKINSYSLSSGNKYLATVSEDKTLKIWNYSDYNLLATINMPEDNGENGCLNKCVFHPEFPNIVLVAGKTGIKLTDTRTDANGRFAFYVVDWHTRKIIDKVGSFNHEVKSMEFSPNHLMLCVFSGYEEMTLFRGDNMSLLENLSFSDEYIYSSRFLNDSSLIVVTDRNVRKFKIYQNRLHIYEKLELMDKIRLTSNQIIYSKDNQNIALINSNGKRPHVKILDSKLFKITSRIKFGKKETSKFKNYLDSIQNNFVQKQDGYLLSAVQYREVTAPDLKIFDDSLYILYDGEPARCLMYPFVVKEIDWELSRVNEYEGLFTGIFHGTFYDFEIWRGNGIRLPKGQKIIIHSKNFVRLDYEGTYFGKTLPAFHRRILNWRNPNYFVISLKDGTVRWYSTKTGNEKLAMFIDKTGKWIFWTPEGYYYSDPRSNSSLIEWRMQNFLNVNVKKASDLRASYFNRLFLLDRLKAIYSGDEDGDMDYSRITTSRNIFLDKYPSIKIEKVEQDNNRLYITYSVSKYDPSIFGSSNVALEIDGKETAFNFVKFRTKGGILEVNNSPEAGEITIYLYGKDGPIDNYKFELVREKYLDVTEVQALIFGISTYTTLGMPALNSSVNDANDFSSMVGEACFSEKSNLNKYRKVIVNGDATRDNILNSITDLNRKLNDKSLTIFYFSGHGLLSGDGDLILLPIDVQHINEAQQKGIRIRKVLELLNALKGYKIVIIDACHSGQATQYKYPNMAIFTSSQQDQYSSDGSNISRSVFTDQLLKGLRFELLSTKKTITFKDIENYLSIHVKEKSGGIQDSKSYIDPNLANVVLLKKKDDDK